jgi:lactate permease
MAESMRTRRKRALRGCGAAVAFLAKTADAALGQHRRKRRRAGEASMTWAQGYNPLGNAFLSTVLAALPVAVLLGSLGVFRVRAHYAALAGLAASLLVAVAVFGMPAGKATTAAAYGAAFGVLPISWILFNMIFLYQLTLDKGLFKVLQDSIGGVTADRRLQLVLIAFCFGAFFEGAAGGGTPVAVTGAILMSLGFSPLAASGLSLIANTAPVAYGGLGTPIVTLQSVTGLDLLDLSAMVGRLLPPFSLLVPFWLVWAFAGVRGMLDVWPAILVAGLCFAVPQFVVSNFHGPWLVDVVAAMCSMAALVLFLRVWQPQEVWLSAAGRSNRLAVGSVERALAPERHPSGAVWRAWTPWLILTVVLLIWGAPQVKAALNSVHLFGISSLYTIEVPGLHNLVQRVPPIAPVPRAEPAIFLFPWLSNTGTGILIAAIISGFVMGFSPGRMLIVFGRTFWIMRLSLLTIIAMLSLSFTTRYGGLDATLGLAFAQTGSVYPLFGTMLGWLGTALTGTDAGSNALFGSLQKITAGQIGIPAVLMAAANSAGGVMGKMIDAQSIVVASTVTLWFGHESDILRYVFFHSVALAILIGLFVTLVAYVPPFTYLVLGQ